jgi:hypothetical protein
LNWSFTAWCLSKKNKVFLYFGMSGITADFVAEAIAVFCQEN